MQRYAVYVSEGVTSLATEHSFDSEEQLHDVLTGHPEVIPHEHFGLGRLTVLVREFSCSAGSIDLLLVDEFGQLVICEIKKGSENADVRRVIAQLLDYGAALWQTELSVVEEQAGRQSSSGDTLVGLVEAKYGSIDDREAFRLRVERCLEDGDFLFLYVVRDLDARTERVVEYLTTRRNLPFFVVEVDNYRAGDAFLMVPRAVGDPRRNDSDESFEDPHADALIVKMDALAARLGAQVKTSKTGKRYYSCDGDAYIGIYRTQRGTEIGLSGLDGANPEAMAAVREALRASGLHVGDEVRWPTYRCGEILHRFDILASTAFRIYFTGSDASAPIIEPRS